ncbi:hypothetical protein M407DRAFT_22254 [Tulasnella calospora MUT 4182]|uniref:Uncharacterized protein n=1 Tax=Tulasnella calospora MUT 4182 TaxID=1051891 RepID=A0A0C3QCM3_9AGAM|nr:hypothetical protein M407DRAFT_22254 [Tulasnella calospora MUT 4182]
MSPQTNSRSSSKVNAQSTTGVGKFSPPSNSASGPQPARGSSELHLAQLVEGHENDGVKASAPAPQVWEPGLSDLGLDFTATPGAEEWQIGRTTDGRAVYSTVGGGVTIEFQKTSKTSILAPRSKQRPFKSSDVYKTTIHLFNIIRLPFYHHHHSPPLPIMSQWINSPSSPKTDPLAVADIDKGSPPSNKALKPLSVEPCVQGRPEKLVERCQNDGEEAPDRLGTPLETPQEWEPELSDFDFDFTASPGAEEWQIGETADGRAFYSNVGGAGVGVTVEFQKWDW